MQAEIIISAASPGQFPREGLPEFAFLGRSNVGKSSLLNALAGKKGLAHTSSTPGRTQSINFFRLEDRWCFVDLPGYGYARVSKEARNSWKLLAEAYLGERGCLELCFLLLDSRHGWKEADLELKRWLESLGRRYMVIATKFDKLNQKEQYRGLAAIRKHLDGGEPVAFSAVTGQGVREIWQTILKTTNPK